MQEALYHPERGYYASGSARIGRSGDYFTNVSVGPLFGKLLSRQLAEMWKRLGAPGSFSIVEQGANNGDFAHDILSSLRDLSSDCFEATDFHIIEPLPSLRPAQQARLSAFQGKVRWHESVAQLDDFCGVHFSNELLDALPVHLVKWNGTEWVERYVTSEGSRLVLTDGLLSRPELLARLARLPPLPAGYETEINLGALEWVDELARRLDRGYVLTIDYGFTREEYYRPERSTGTLTAYAGHRRQSDPLARPGEIDLTAHVEFTSIIERAAERGLALAGFTDQHHFMVGLGRLHFPDGAAMDAAAQRELRAFKTLMHPTLMGRSFKVLCLAKGMPAAPPLAGLRDAR